MSVTTSSVYEESDAMSTGTESSYYSNSSLRPLSEEERRRYLNLLQERDTRLLIPTLIFLAALAVVGLFGNSIVLAVYSRKVRRNATDVFIMAIAAFDLLTNTLGIPNEINDTFYYWVYDMPAVCKFRVFVNAFTTMTSGLALLAVAVTRYKKVCRPFGRQTSLKTAKRMNVAIVLVCALCAAPQAVLYGVMTKKSPRPDIVGHECDISDGYRQTIWPMIYAGFLMVLFLGVYIPLIVLYILVGIQAWKHSKVRGISIVAKTSMSSEGTHSDTLNSEVQSSGKHLWSRFRLFKRKFESKTVSPSNRRDCEDHKHEKTDKLEMTHGHTELTVLRTTFCSDENLSNTEISRGINTLLYIPAKDTTDSDLSMLHATAKLNEEDINATINSSKADENDKEKNAKLESGAQIVCVETCPDETANPNDDKVKKAKDVQKQKKSPENNRTTSEQSDICLVASVPQWISTTKEEEEKDRNSRNPEGEISPTTTYVAIKCKDVPGTGHVEFKERDAEGEKTVKRLGRQKSFSADHNTDVQITSRRVKGQTRRVLSRTTFMLIIITVVYVIAYVPYLTLISVKFAMPSFYENLSAVGESLYNLFLRFFFINSGANAIIYSICDVRFRKEVAKIIKCKR